MSDSELGALAARLREFARARDWEQFHAPKNLAMALAVEAAELMEPFQWRSSAESEALDEATRDAVALELADVLLYTVRLADRLGIDLHAAAYRKIALNEQRYPADKARGHHRKYTEL
jgi:NTP pyrophosphatase (non-canonical NTP hydrolase)